MNGVLGSTSVQHSKSRARRPAPRATSMFQAQMLRSEPSPDGMLCIVCTHCESPLALHQPDPGQPERLLGICEECAAWFLIEEESGLIAALPARLSE